MRRLLPVTLLVLHVSIVSAQAPILHSIDLHGNRGFTKREILGWMSLKPLEPFTQEQLRSDLKVIASQYHQAGYYFAVIDPSLRYTSDSSSVSVALNVKEGSKVTIGSLSINGIKMFTREEVLARFETRVGDVLDERVIEQDIDQLLSLYEVRGYPFAKVRVENIRLGENGESLEVAIRIEEGAIIRISEVRIEGNTTTKESVVIRQARINLGEPYDHEKVAAVRQRLLRLKIFSSVSEPELYIRGERAGLLIKVKEGNANTFDGILGYIPASGSSQEGFLTGLVKVSMRNLFGTARKLRVRWQREDRSTQELGVQYYEPWVLNLPVNLGLGFAQRQQDSTYVKRRLEFNASLPLSENLSVGANLNRESVIPSTERVTPSPLLKSNTTSVGVDLEYETRDDAVSPRRGLYYRTDYQIGTKDISKPANASSDIDEQVTIQQLRVDVLYYVPTFFRQVLALSFHGRELRGDPIDESDLFRFGGTNSLRGYRENQFLGSRLVWSNIEYRFLLGRRSFFYGFFDGGYYFRPQISQASMGGAALQVRESAQEFKYGVGVGLLFETRLGLIGLSFALGEGDTFSTGKVHIGLINEF